MIVPRGLDQFNSSSTPLDFLMRGTNFLHMCADRLHFECQVSQAKSGVIIQVEGTCPFGRSQTIAAMQTGGTAHRKSLGGEESSKTRDYAKPKLEMCKNRGLVDSQCFDQSLQTH